MRIAGFYGVKKGLINVCLIVVAAAIIAGAAHAIKPMEGVICSVPTRAKVVALTYDDGPHPTFTPELLRVLAEHHVKATFFMIGRLVEKYPTIARAVAAGGHVIGNHTYSHPQNLELLKPAPIAEELDKAEAAIDRITGRRPVFFRPPKGLLDPEVLRIAREKHLETVLWTISADHHDAPTPELMAKRVVNNITPGSIVLLHDGYFGTRWKDVKATELIIEALHRQGYRFVTLPELLELKQAPGKQTSRAQQSRPRKPAA